MSQKRLNGYNQFAHTSCTCVRSVDHSLPWRLREATSALPVHHPLAAKHRLGERDGNRFNAARMRRESKMRTLAQARVPGCSTPLSAADEFFVKPGYCAND